MIVSSHNQKAGAHLPVIGKNIQQLLATENCIAAQLRRNVAYKV